jgi:hypothetical protein
VVDLSIARSTLMRIFFQHFMHVFSLYTRIFSPILCILLRTEVQCPI